MTESLLSIVDGLNELDSMISIIAVVAGVEAEQIHTMTALCHERVANIASEVDALRSASSA